MKEQRQKSNSRGMLYEVAFYVRKSLVWDVNKKAYRPPTIKSSNTSYVHSYHVVVRRAAVGLKSFSKTVDDFQDETKYYVLFFKTYIYLQESELDKYVYYARRKAAELYKGDGRVRNKLKNALFNLCVDDE